LLIYCDNFVLSDSDIESVVQNSADITFLVQLRDIGNIKLNSKQQAFYTSDERSSDHKAVEMGNISVKTKRFMEILKKTQDLPKTLEKLSNELVCSAIISNSPINSISNLKTYTSNLRRRRILLLDRDGILVEKMPHREYLSNLYDYKPRYENWSTSSYQHRLFWTDVYSYPSHAFRPRAGANCGGDEARTRIFYFPNWRT
jgi:hypothetical protein